MASNRHTAAFKKHRRDKPWEQVACVFGNDERFADVTDTELMELFAEERDESAFAEMYCRHQRRLIWRLTHDHLLDDGEANDLSQEIWTKVAKDIPDILSKQLSLGASINRRVDWAAASHLRARRKLMFIDFSPRRGEVNCGFSRGKKWEQLEQAIRQEYRRTLMRAIVHLPRKTRDAFWLMYSDAIACDDPDFARGRFEQLLQGAADELGISRNAFRSRLKLANSDLRKEFDEELTDSPTNMPTCPTCGHGVYSGRSFHPQCEEIRELLAAYPPTGPSSLASCPIELEAYQRLAELRGNADSGTARRVRSRLKSSAAFDSEESHTTIVERLRTVIREAGCASIGELKRKTHSTISARDRDSALAVLIESGEVLAVPRRSKRGSPRIVYAWAASYVEDVASTHSEDVPREWAAKATEPVTAIVLRAICDHGRLAAKELRSALPGRVKASAIREAVASLIAQGLVAESRQPPFSISDRWVGVYYSATADVA